MNNMLNKKITHKKLRGSKTKKPFKSKNRNRQGSTKLTFDGKVRDSLNPNKPVRFLKKKYEKRILQIAEEFPVCQVCEQSYNLDIPHHTKRGANKDDRYMISICVECHRAIHSAGEYNNVNKTEDECIEIALKNNKYLEKLEEE